MSVVVDKPGQQYFIVFCDSKLRGLQWLPKGYQHCAIVRKEFDTLWTVIQDGYNRMDVSTYLIEDYPDPLMLFDTNSTIIPVEIQTKDRYRGTLCLFNCVEVCKAMLGIKKTFILTPHQLYRYCYEQLNRPRKGCETPSKASSRGSSQDEAKADAGEGRSGAGSSQEESIGV